MRHDNDPPKFYWQDRQSNVAHECPRCGDVHLSAADTIPSVDQMAVLIRAGAEKVYLRPERFPDPDLGEQK